MKRLFNRLTILQKILFSSLILTLPIVVLLYYMVSGFNREIETTRLEVGGIRLILPLQALDRSVSEHQLLTRLYIQGDKGLEQKIGLLSRDIDGLLSAVEKEAKQLEEPLRITEKGLAEAGIEQAHISRIAKNWQEARANWKDADAASNDNRHEDIVKSLHGLIKRIGDTSNLVLDSGLDTYYMVDTAFLTLGKDQERLSEFLLFLESLIFKGMRSHEDVLRVSAFAGLLESDLEHLHESVATALKENKRLHGANTSLQKSVPPLFEKYRESFIPFIVPLQRFINDPKFVMTIADLEPGRELLETVSKLRETSMIELQKLLGNRVEGVVRKRFLALLLSLSTLFLAGLTVLVISRGITRSLNRVVNIAGEIADGNIRKAMEEMKGMGSSGSIGSDGKEESPRNARNEVERLFRAIATMTSNLQALLSQVGKSGIQVTSSSTEIAASARELEATVAEQASSINEVSATSREISSVSRGLVDTMKRVSGMAARSAKLANSSMDSLSGINATMKGLLESTTESSSKLQMVTLRMDSITDVITTITKVANQINLLSLNAAIEAEKAGEQGIGFSVVAREIRRLADQTAVSTLDIEAMIAETQEAVKQGVAAVDAYQHQTRTSTEKIAEISVDLLGAIEHTRELVPEFEMVNHGMQTQSESAAQISEAMDQLNQAAAQTRDSLREFRKVTEQLNEAVSDLQDEVARFKVG